MFLPYINSYQLCGGRDMNFDAVKPFHEKRYFSIETYKNMFSRTALSNIFPLFQSYCLEKGWADGVRKKLKCKWKGRLGYQGGKTEVKKSAVYKELESS